MLHAGRPLLVHTIRSPLQLSLPAHHIAKLLLCHKVERHQAEAVELLDLACCAEGAAFCVRTLKRHRDTSGTAAKDAAKGGDSRVCTSAACVGCSRRRVICWHAWPPLTVHLHLQRKVCVAARCVVYHRRGAGWWTTAAVAGCLSCRVVTRALLPGQRTASVVEASAAGPAAAVVARQVVPLQVSEHARFCKRQWHEQPCISVCVC